LSNGITFVTRPDTIAPRVGLSLVIRTGAADETPETAGWRRLLVNAMLRGTPKGYELPAGSTLDDAEALPRAAEKAGGALGATVGDDFVEIYAVGDSQKAEGLLDLALAFWQKPRLSDEDLKNARERTQSQLEADDLDTAGKTQAALRSQIFRDARGELSAYGLPDFGTTESLAKLSDEKLRALHATRLATGRLTVAATGAFDAAALRQKLESLPASASGEPKTPFFAPPKAGAPALVVRELPIPSAWVFVSYPLAGNTNNDAAALRVLAAALGDSSKARLPGRLLKSQIMGSSPVASTVAAQFIPRRYAGEMVLYAQTGPQNVERVKNALLDEIRKVRETPLSALELESAKVYARGSWSIERQNLRERAFQTALGPALGAPADTTWPARLQSVSSADVQRVAKKYLGSYAVALVMPGADE
jgi:predicted Zn-dependent peptidase